MNYDSDETIHELIQYVLTYDMPDQEDVNSIIAVMMTRIAHLSVYAICVVLALAKKDIDKEEMLDDTLDLMRQQIRSGVMKRLDTLDIEVILKRARQ